MSTSPMIRWKRIAHEENPSTLVETSTLSHQTINRSLDAYVDGTLPDSRRAEVDAHLRICAECAKSLRQIHRLELVLDDLPRGPSVLFPHFWAKLEERLPNHVEKRAPFFRPGRVAAAFALAVLASLMGTVALASDAVMPDNPLYAVKHVRQEVQLALAGPRERPRLELVLGKQRLHEALLMVQRERPDLALASIRDFRALLIDATSLLEEAPGGQPDTPALVSSIVDLETELEAVRQASIAQAGGNADDMAALDVAVHADLSTVNKVEASLARGGIPLVEPSTEPMASPEASASAAAPSSASSPPTQSSVSDSPEAAQPSPVPSPQNEPSPIPSDDLAP